MVQNRDLNKENYGFNKEIAEIDILSASKNNANLSKIIKGYLPIWASIIAIFFLAAAVFIYKPGINIESNSNSGGLIPDSDDPFLGKANAPITLIEIANPLCPDCKKFFDTIEIPLTKKYIDMSSVKLYNWPTLEGGANLLVFEAMYCAAEQKKYKDYRAYLYYAPRTENLWLAFDKNNYIKFAENLGLNRDKFTSCIDGHKYQREIEDKDKKRISADLAESGIIILVNGEKIPYATLDEISAAIERALYD